jgi:hypothetical protein
MGNIEHILAKCITDIESGSSDIKTCLNRYPHHRQELEPLLKLVGSIHQPEIPIPSNQWKALTKAKIFEEIARQKPVPNFWQRFPPLRSVVMAAVALMLVTSGGTVYAAQSALPGETLYGIKTVWEQVRMGLTFGDESRFDYSLVLAEKRIDEIRNLGVALTDQVSPSSSRYQEHISMATDIMNQDETGVLRERFCLALQTHLSTLDSIIDSTVGHIRVELTTMSEFQFQQQAKGLVAFAEIDPVKATKLNLVAMDYQLQRAQMMAAQGHQEDSLNALNRYGELKRNGQGFGRGSGQETMEIDRLNAAATSAQLQGLAGMYDKASDENITLIEKAMIGAAGDYKQAVRGLNAVGYPGTIPDMPTIPSQIPGELQQQIQAAASGEPPQNEGENENQGDEGTGSNGTGGSSGSGNGR